MRVLVVDDEIRNAELTALALQDAGHESEFVGGGEKALARLERAPFDAVVTDLRMAPPDGLALLEQVRKRWPAVTVVLMTAYASLETARRALKLGAYDYVDKEGGFHEELHAILERAARERRLEADNRRLAGTVDQLTRGLATIVGGSPAVRQAVELARKVAATDSTVLLRGESGTGKDLYARAIHFTSRRAAGPWVKVNCAAIPRELIESELFGHERGAFTGAVRQKPGRFEDAHHGTLFLDEIGELPLALQVKLLQVLEEKTFTRVGGNQPITVDVRIIAATHRDLMQMAVEGKFREDLYYRLKVVALAVPPLRERKEDIPALIDAFIADFNGRNDGKIQGLAPQALRLIMEYDWPGNVRELKNALESAAILATGETIGPEAFSELLASRSTRPAARVERPAAPAGAVVLPPGTTLAQAERELIVAALQRCKTRREAARSLGLGLRTLYTKLREHGLHPPADRGGAETA